MEEVLQNMFLKELNVKRLAIGLIFKIILAVQKLHTWIQQYFSQL